MGMFDRASFGMPKLGENGTTPSGEWAKWGTGAALGGINIISNVANSLQGSEEAKTAKLPEMTANSRDTFLEMMNNYQPLKLKKESGSLSGLSGLASGAGAGMVAGPWGAAIGGTAGLMGGLFGAGKRNRQNRAAEKRAAENALGQANASNDAITQQSIDSAMLNYAAYGGNFFPKTSKNNLISFNNGGTHEQNPLTGIPMGIGANGKPNMVEEGETRFNNTVFSNRVIPLPMLLEPFGIDNKKNMSYAQLSEQLNKSFKERPFDPISTQTKKALFDRLSAAQETQRELFEKQAKLKQLQNLFKDKKQFKNMLEGAKETPYELMTNSYKQGTDSLQFTIPRLSIESNNKLGTPILSRKGLNKMRFRNLSREEVDDFNYSNFSIPKPSIEINTKLETPKKIDPLLSRKDLDDTRFKNISREKVDDFNYFSPGMLAPAVANAVGFFDALNSTPSSISLPRMTQRKRLGISDALPYNPIDKEYIANKLREVGAGTRNAITNTAYGNAGIAQTGLLSADYNSQNALAGAYLQADETNRGRLHQSIADRRGITQYNNTLDADELAFNNNALLQEFQINEANRAARRNAIRGGLNAMANDISDLSRFFVDRKLIDKMFK